MSQHTLWLSTEFDYCDISDSSGDTVYTYLDSVLYKVETGCTFFRFTTYNRSTLKTHIYIYIPYTKGAVRFHYRPDI